MRVGVNNFDAYKFDLPPSPKGYWIYERNYLDALEVDVPPRKKELKGEISTFATPSEYEPVSFVIYAQKKMEDVEIRLSDLRSVDALIPRENIDVRLVRRCLQRKWYYLPARRENCAVVARFLERKEMAEIPGKHLKQVWLTIKVPSRAKQGTYRGWIDVAPRNLPPSKLELSLEVLPFKLKNPAHKRYGLYYNLGDLLVERGLPERARLELEDMREHGVTVLYPHLNIAYTGYAPEVEISYEVIKRGIDLMREFGFEGPLIVGTGFMELARWLGHRDIGHSGEEGESLDSDEEFLGTAKKAMEGVLRLRRENNYPEIVLTHMDEVFNRGRLPLYIRLTKAGQQVPDVRFYMTVHTVVGSGWEKKMEQIDPYVDIRCYHGHSMDQWIASGHSFNELKEELERSGDEAWTYYNPGSIDVTPKWMRIINGLWMWLSPFKVHIPWTYHYIMGNPFDDSDGHDYGFAFPSQEDGKTPVPTTLWEAYREGIDDVKYLYTLEHLVSEMKEKKPSLTIEAESWLKRIREMIPKQLKVQNSALVGAIAEKFTGKGLQEIRYMTAQHIIKLLRGTN